MERILEVRGVGISWREVLKLDWSFEETRKK